jgi:hypothetical protein
MTYTFGKNGILPDFSIVGTYVSLFLWLSDQWQNLEEDALQPDPSLLQTTGAVHCGQKNGNNIDKEKIFLNFKVSTSIIQGYR